MLSFKLDSKSPFQVRWPASDVGVISLGQALLAAEAALPAADRFPRLDLIQPRLDVAVTARESAASGEAERSAVSAAEQQAFDQARALIRKITAGLSYRHLDELPVLEQWGIPVVQTRSGPRTRTPQGKRAMLEMLARYAAREQLLPEAQRLTDPLLTEVVAARQALQTAMTERLAASTQREVSVRTRSVEAQALLDLLQVVAAYHVVVNFGGAVDPRLQKLGFEVIGL